MFLKLKCLLSILLIPHLLIAKELPTVIITQSVDTSTHEFLIELQSTLREHLIQDKVPVITHDIPPTTQGLLSTLKAAQDLQFNFKNQQAIELLQLTINSLEKKSLPLDDSKHIADIYLLMAYCYKNEGNIAEQNHSLMNAARLNPNLQANPMLFPPSLIGAFETAKNKIWATGVMGQITIESNPEGASVFLNGNFKGKTPLRLDQYPTGTHYMNLQSKNGESFKKIQIKPGINETLHLNASGHISSSEKQKLKTEKDIKEILKQDQANEGITLTMTKSNLLSVMYLKNGKSKKTSFKLSSTDTKLIAEELLRWLEKL